MLCKGELARKLGPLLLLLHSTDEALLVSIQSEFIPFSFLSDLSLSSNISPLLLSVKLSDFAKGDGSL